MQVFHAVFVVINRVENIMDHFVAMDVHVSSREASAKDQYTHA
jgi:Zinc finger, C4 type (two domains)